MPRHARRRADTKATPQEPAKQGPAAPFRCGRLGLACGVRRRAREPCGRPARKRRGQGLPGARRGRIRDGALTSVPVLPPDLAWRVRQRQRTGRDADAWMSATDAVTA